MESHNLPLFAMLLSCSFALAGEASADNCSGYDIMVNRSSETIDLGKGQTLMVNRDYSMIVTDDPKARDNLTIGECHATVVSLPNDQVKVNGFCARRDKEGDTYSQEFESIIGPGGEKGSWKGLWGTGKFARASSTSGWFHGLTRDGKVFAVRWGGNCDW